MSANPVGPAADEPEPQPDSRREQLDDAFAQFAEDMVETIRRRKRALGLQRETASILSRAWTRIEEAAKRRQERGLPLRTKDPNFWHYVRKTVLFTMRSLRRVVDRTPYHEPLLSDADAGGRGRVDSEADDPLSMAQDRETLHELVKACDLLASQYKVTLMLWCAGFGFGEIAGMLGLPDDEEGRARVMMWKAEALRILRQRFDPRTTR